MKKKTVLVETSKQGKQWSIKVSGSNPAIFVTLAHHVRTTLNEAGAQLLNGADPFGDTISKRKRKIHKPVMGPAEIKHTIDRLEDRAVKS